MDAPKVREFLDLLAKQIEELEMETKLDVAQSEAQLGPTLRTLLPMIGSKGDVALTEILVTQWDDDSDLLFFYTTMIMEIGPGYEALKEMVLDWNLESPVGAFGIYRQGRQFYHKYTFPFMLLQRLICYFPGNGSDLVKIIFLIQIVILDL